MATTAAVPGSDVTALRVSVIVSTVFAAVSLVWGWAVNSQLILFDGLYTSAAVVLSLLGLQTLRTVSKGADSRYPWGREVYEPLTIIFKAAALGGLCVYAAVTSVAEILDGGRAINARWALAYAGLSCATCIVVTLYLRRVKSTSDLVAAEAAEWFGDALLTTATLAGFGIALGLTAAGRPEWAAYVDPVMVVLASTAFLAVPVGLIRRGFREVVTMSPPVEILDQIHRHVDEVQRGYFFVESFVRASKTGGRLDIEIFYVLDHGSLAQTIGQLDDVRQAIHDRLEPLGLERAVTVAFTANRAWAI